MNARVIASGMAALALTASVSLQAHHSLTAEYDPKSPVTLAGRITKIEWVNPHAFIEIECRTEQGEREDWRVEAGAPFALARAGITRNLLTIDAVVTINGVRAKNGSQRAWGIDITFANGETKRLTDEPDRPVTPIEFAPPSFLERLMVSWPFLPYVVGALPVVVLAAGLLVRRRRRARPAVPK